MLKKYTEHIIGEYQAGFRTGKSTTDQIFTVKNLLEKAWEHNVEIHQIFVDFQKACDSIQRDKLYAIMANESNYGRLNLPCKDRNNYD
jgi:sorting nexin-29